MSVRCLFFAQSAAWAGARSREVACGERTPLRVLLGRERWSAEILARAACLRVAVNQELKTFEEEIRDGDEVAFLPPYSGG